MSRDLSKINVEDSFGAMADSALPTVALALDRAAVKAAFKRGLPRLASDHGQVIVKSIEVIRHKPGKRCVIEYDTRIERDGVRVGAAVLIGKIRARRFGNEAHRLQRQLWNQGFQSDSTDGISVPEPIGVLAEMRMWVQRKVPGVLASEALAGPDGVTLARRVTEALHKLHRANVPAERTHTMADELRILRECLKKVCSTRKSLCARVERLLAACETLGASVPVPVPRGIHRDFYPAQVIVDGPRLHLLDFDLYCLGDPALDVGNFLGHVIEENLRRRGDPHAWRDREDALEERFVELSGKFTRAAVRTYTTLTLARHVYLSTQFPDRADFTECLLDLCEQRLALGRA